MERIYAVSTAETFDPDGAVRQPDEPKISRSDLEHVKDSLASRR
jgi:hypothetical protein